MVKYSEKGSFSSFGELNSAVKQDADRTRAEESRERFEHVAKGKFSKIAKGNFQSSLKGVESISILPVESKSDGKWILNVIPFYTNRNGKQAHTTLRLTDDGEMIGRIPSELTHSLDAIKNEVLGIIEKENIEFWHQTDLPIVPHKDMLEVKDVQGGSEEDPGRYIDPERLAFYAAQREARFGAVSRRDGFDGYKLIFFDGADTDFIILDNEIAPNAAFILDLGQKLDLPDKVDEQQKEAALKAVWGPIVELARTKNGLKELGAIKLVHNKSWKARMLEHIEKRTTRLES